MRLMVDTIPGLVWSTRPDGSAEFFNQLWLEYTGLSAEQALDWGWKVAIHPDDLPRILDTFHEALSLERSFEVEGRFRRWDGQFRWFLFRGNPLLDGSGKVVKWYGTNTDLEERKRAEDALRDSEQSFRLIVDGIAGLVAVVTSAGEVDGVNRQALEYFGKRTEQLKGWLTREAVHPDDLPGVTSAWRHSVQTVTPYDVEHRLRRADGVYLWFRARGLPLLDTQGRVVRWYVLLTDIDERKRSSEALEQSEDRYRTVLETATDAVISIDQGGKIIFANQATTKTFGYQIPEMIGQPLTLLMPEYMRDLLKRDFLYAFPKPGNVAKSILIMNVRPSIGVNPPGPTTAEPFASDAVYELKIDTDGDTVANIAYRARFSSTRAARRLRPCAVLKASRPPAQATMAKRFHRGSTEVSTGREARVTEAGDYRIFAGWRSDPFFFDTMGALNDLQFTGLW